MVPDMEPLCDIKTWWDSTFTMIECLLVLWQVSAESFQSCIWVWYLHPGYWPLFQPKGTRDLRLQTHGYRLGTSPVNWNGIIGQFLCRLICHFVNSFFRFLTASNRPCLLNQCPCYQVPLQFLKSSYWNGRCSINLSLLLSFSMLRDENEISLLSPHLSDSRYSLETHVHDTMTWYMQMLMMCRKHQTQLLR